MNKLINYTLSAFSAVAILASCNDNDDAATGLEGSGITINGDVDCCSAEEAFQVYKFLQGVRNIPELTAEIDGKYNIFAYSSTGDLHVGYNDIYFVATKKVSGNYVKDFNVTDITPLMAMGETGARHSAPTGGEAATYDKSRPALKRSWVSLPMPTSSNGAWTLSYSANVLSSAKELTTSAINVSALPNGQVWLTSFKLADATYYLTLTDPTKWQTGQNEIRAYVSKVAEDKTKPFPLASETFAIEIDPRMPDMGNHTSPSNNALTLQADGSYTGSIGLTMTGLWRIHLTVRNSVGDIVAGGDCLNGGYSSLFWDVTI